MPEIKVEDTISKPLIGGSKDAVSWLGEGIKIIREINTLINTINQNPFVKRFGGDNVSNVLQSGAGAKSMKMIPQPQKLTQQEPNTQDLKSFFSTPEGLNTIIEAIDQITPLIGDVKLSKVKNLIKEIGGKKDAEIKPDGHKDTSGKDTPESTSSKTTKPKKPKRNKS